MHFQRGVTNSETHALTNGGHGISPISFPYQQTVISPHTQNSFSLNRFGLDDFSALQAVTQAWSLSNGGEGSVKVNDGQPGLDDLSALVQKCKAKEPPSSLERSPFSLHGPQLCYKSGSDITQQLYSSKRRRVNGEESLKGKLSCGGLSSSRENHILSERLRRSEMNHLFSQMFSLLPSPPAKVDKASILSETINYIQSLQRRLAIHSEKPASRLLSTQTGGSVHPSIKSKRNSVVESDQNPENLRFICNGQDMFITMNCMQKAKLLPSIILVLETHNMHVMDMFVTTTDTEIFYCLHVKAEEILDNTTKETLHEALHKYMKQV
ncbi:hypothetical protein SUGI_0415930 [Cryptomeria japonica]|uniref:transcription factor bHLH94 n=1 Tax=Cryptomeria japonica TaxID=3369 RepID=UPI002408B191|nr:transcription factor bHLH94 [Cryptomeria japonica]GLJ22148.1 hypothetical protein SUGI_0415930 [Cryptomeria japonica]